MVAKIGVEISVLAVILLYGAGILFWLVIKEHTGAYLLCYP